MTPSCEQLGCHWYRQRCTVPLRLCSLTGGERDRRYIPAGLMRVQRQRPLLGLRHFPAEAFATATKSDCAVTRLVLSFCASEDNLQAGDDRVHVHTQSHTIIPGWRLNVLASSVSGRRHQRSANTRTLVLRRKKNCNSAPESLLFPLLSYGTYLGNFECCPV